MTMAVDDSPAPSAAPSVPDVTQYHPVTPAGPPAPSLGPTQANSSPVDPTQWHAAPLVQKDPYDTLRANHDENAGIYDPKNQDNARQIAGMAAREVAASPTFRAMAPEAQQDAYQKYLNIRLPHQFNENTVGQNKSIDPETGQPTDFTNTNNFGFDFTKGRVASGLSSAFNAGTSALGDIAAVADKPVHALTGQYPSDVLTEAGGKLATNPTDTKSNLTGRVVGSALPIIGASVVNPAAGAAIGAAQGVGSGILEGRANNYTPGQTAALSTERGIFNAILGLVPGGKAAEGAGAGGVALAKELGKTFVTVGGLNIEQGVLDSEVKQLAGIKDEGTWNALKNAAKSGEGWAQALLFSAAHGVSAKLAEQGGQPEETETPNANAQPVASPAQPNAPVVSGGRAADEQSAKIPTDANGRQGVGGAAEAAPNPTDAAVSQAAPAAAPEVTQWHPVETDTSTKENDNAGKINGATSVGEQSEGSQGAGGVGREGVGSGQQGSETSRATGEENAKPGAAETQGEKEVGATAEAEPSVASGQAGTPPGAAHESELSSESPDQKVSSTGIKNAISAEDRKRFGLDERTTPERRSFEKVVSDAKDVLKADPHAAENLIDALRAKPYPLTDTEGGLLAIHKVGLEKQLETLNQAVGDAYHAGDKDLEITKRMQMDAKVREIRELDQLAEDAGAVGARGQNARKIMLAMDTSLSHQLAVREAAKGEPLTSKEIEGIRQENADLKAKADKAEKAAAAANEEKAQAHADLEVAKLRVEAKSQEDAANPQVKSIASRIVAHLDKLSDAAEARIRVRGIKVNAFGDVANLADMSIVGASQIAKGLVKFGDWSAAMVKKFGDEIKPHLPTIFDEANKTTDRIVEKFAGPKFADSVKESLKPTPKYTLGKLEARAKDGAQPQDVQQYVKALALEKVRAGITTREPLIDALHADVKKAFPNITREETRDLMSGYGDFKTLDKEPAKVALRDINQQSQKLAQLEALNKGQPPKATGVERQSPDTETQALTKQVNAKKKALGIQTTDPETQLKSTLDGMKTRAKNAINLLQMEIDTGKRIVEGKSVKISDPELEVLRKQLADVREQHEKVFGKPGQTDEQKLTQATAAAKKNLESWNERLDKARRGVFDNPITGRKVNGPELDAVRAQTEAAKAEYNELEKAANPPATASERQAKAIQKQIDALDEKVKAGDTSTKGPRQGPDTPYIQALKERRQALSDKLADMRKNDPVLQAKNAADAAEASATEYERKLGAGEFVKPGKPEPSSPELDAARLHRDTAKAAYNAAREADPEYQKARDTASNESYRTALAQRKADLMDRMAREDYGPRQPQPKTKLDAASEAAKADYEGARKIFDAKTQQWELKRRPWWEKDLDYGFRFVRAGALSSIGVFKKLLGASALGPISHGLGEVAGSGLRAIPGIRGLSDRAPTEGGGFSPSAHFAAATKAITKGWLDAWQKLASKGHMDEMDKLYGDAGKVNGALEFFGLLHGAEKAGLKRYAFEFALHKYADFALKNKLDVTDPAVQTTMGAAAYQQAMRALFFDKSKFVQGIQAMAETWGRPDKPGQPPPFVGTAGKYAARALTPVATVGSNIEKRTLLHVVGLPVGAGEAMHAIYKGVENVQPEQADRILRHLKAGSVGLGAFLLGAAAKNYLGGQYVPGKKQNQELKPGDVKIGDTTIDHQWMHNPLVASMQSGATSAETMQSAIAKGGTLTESAAKGLLQATTGIVTSDPFVSEGIKLSGVNEPNRQTSVLGEIVRGLIVPQIVQQAAAHYDTDAQGNPINRKAKGFIDNVKLGIPGLRETVK